jgi:hypothetical protein
VGSKASPSDLVTPLLIVVLGPADAAADVVGPTAVPRAARLRQGDHVQQGGASQMSWMSSKTAPGIWSRSYPSRAFGVIRLNLNSN